MIEELNFHASTESYHTRYLVFGFADEIIASLNIKKSINF
jgi:hypothetical protein